MSNMYIPNAFQIPNAVIDQHMAELSGTAFKCYALIIRKTAGWHKEVDYIPVSQFLQLCGIKKPETITSALQELEKIGLIVRIQSRGKVTGYKLNLVDETTPEKGVPPENGTTPENGGNPPLVNGGTTTPEKGGTSKPNTKPINTKPNNIRASNFTKAKQIAMLADHGIDEQLANDYLTVRADKKGKTLTQTALNGLIRESEKAGLDLNAGLTLCVERNWISFMASWLLKSDNYSNNAKPSVKNIPNHTQGGVLTGW